MEEVRPGQISPPNASRTVSKKLMLFQNLNIYSLVGCRICLVANLTELHPVCLHT